MKNIFIQNLKKIFFSAFVFFLFGLTKYAAAQPVLDGLSETANEAGYDISASGSGDISVMIGTVLRSLIGLVGTLFLLLIIYAGVLWMTSAGNEEKISKAKKIMSNSAIGLVVVIISYALVSLIFDVIIQATN